MSFTYSLYGLTLSVPFHCPILTHAAVDDVPDVTIVEGLVPPSLAEPFVEGQNWQAAPGRFLLRGGNRSGRFLVESGQRITLQRNPTTEDPLLCANLLASVIVALLRQRGNLVLHASVVMTPRGAVAISGASGVGKSTTQAALLSRDCRMVTDDVAVLQMGNYGMIMVLPGIPKINLCEDVAAGLGYDVAALQRNPLRKIKVVVPVGDSDMVTEPVPLKEIFLLSRHVSSGLNVHRLTGSEKFIGQQDCIYGPLFPEEHSGMFPLIRALAEQVEMTRLERPNKGCSVDKVVEAILHG